MNATETVVDAVAVARLTRLVQDDEMPFGPAREWALDVFGEWKAAELLRCPWCLSPYLAAAVALARWHWPRAWPILARIAAASAVTGHLAEWSER